MSVVVFLQIAVPVIACVIKACMSVSLGSQGNFEGHFLFICEALFANTLCLLGPFRSFFFFVSGTPMYVMVLSNAIGSYYCLRRADLFIVSLFHFLVALFMNSLLLSFYVFICKITM